MEGKGEVAPEFKGSKKILLKKVIGERSNPVSPERLRVLWRLGVKRGGSLAM